MKRVKRVAIVAALLVVFALVATSVIRTPRASLTVTGVGGPAAGEVGGAIACRLSVPPEWVAVFTVRETGSPPARHTSLFLVPPPSPFRFDVMLAGGRQVVNRTVPVPPHDPGSLVVLPPVGRQYDIPYGERFELARWTNGGSPATLSVYISNRPPPELDSYD